MTHPYRAIVFDLDGTLLDTAGEITDAANACFREFSLPKLTLAQTRSWVGHGAENFLQQALIAAERAAEFSAPDAFAPLYARFLHHYAQLSGSNSQPYPHVLAALRQLKDNGLILCVLTNKIKSFSDQALQAHGIFSLFDEILGGDSFPNKKPDPVGITYIKDRYNLPLESILMVGDSSTDIQTARQAGIAVWAVPYGYNQGQPIELSQPDRVIADFSVFLSPPT